MYSTSQSRDVIGRHGRLHWKHVTAVGAAHPSAAAFDVTTALRRVLPDCTRAAQRTAGGLGMYAPLQPGADGSPGRRGGGPGSCRPPPLCDVRLEDQSQSAGPLAAKYG